MAEQPALHRIHVIGYAANDRDFPTVSLIADPRVAGYQVPKDLSTCPDKRYPNHVFTGAQPIAGDQRVRHVWEILPSPWVPFTRYDDDLGPVQGRRRSVKNEGQVASLSADKRVTYEAREGSAIVYTELEETWSVKVDEDGNSLFPIRDRDFYDPSRGPVQERRQLFVPTGEEEGSLENVNGIITQTSYEPYNEFLSVKIVQTYKVNGPQLIGKATDNDGQLVTVTTQRKGADGYIPPNPTATRTVEVSREDAESLVERIVDTPEVFKANTFSVERPDPIPQKFRVAVPIRSSQEVVVGKAQQPALTKAGEISKSEEQRNKFIKRVSATSRDQSVLPQTLIGKTTNNERQEVTITETLQKGNTIETPTATTTIESEALGDENYVITKTEVDEVFGAEVFRKAKDDLTPQKFRGAQEELTTEENIEGIASDNITLADGEFSKSEQQVNKFVKRVSTTSRSTEAVDPLTEFVLTAQGQVGTRKLTLASGPQSFDPSATLIDANVEALGDGRTVKSETVVPSVFPNKSITKTKPDLTPEKFKAKQEDTITEESVEGTIDTSLTLEDGEFRKSEEQVTEFVKRISSTTRDIDATTDLTETIITNQGQVATRTLRLSATPQSIQPDALLIDGSIEELGDGRTIKTEVRVDGVFPNRVFSVERPDPAPQKFRVELPTITEQETIEGEAEPPELLGDEISKSEQQQTEFTKRTSVSKREGTPDGELLGKQTGQWGEETVTETYNEDETIQVGYKILSNRKTPLGGGKFLGEKVEVVSPLALTERKIDAETGVIFTTTKTLVSAATPLPATTANQIAEITPIDAYNSIQIITSIDSIPPPEIFESSIDVSYPDVLEEVGIDWDSSTGGGAGSSGGLNIAQITQNKYQWAAQANANATARIVGAVYTKIRRGHRGNVRAQVTRTYYLNPPTNIPTATLFAPVYGAVTIRGKGISINNKTSVGGYGDSVTGSSSGFEEEINNFANSVQFGPFCHNNPILVNSNPPSGISATFTASSGSVPAGAYPATEAQATATASAQLQLGVSSPSGSALTSGYSHIAAVRVEKWRFGIWIQEVYTAFHP